MKSVYLIYKTDTWHSYNSRELIGVGTTPKRAIEICVRRAKNEDHRISDVQLELLKSIKQTQGYDGEGEFHFEEMKTDILL